MEMNIFTEYRRKFRKKSTSRSNRGKNAPRKNESTKRKIFAAQGAMSGTLSEFSLSSVQNSATQSFPIQAL